MIYDTGSIPRDLVCSMLASASEASADQKKALKDELTKDPESRGYASAKNPHEVRLLLCFPYQVPNPEDQGYIIVQVKRDEDMEKLLISKGIITQNEIETERKVLDPDYQALLEMPARSDEVWGFGLIPSDDEIAEALA